MRTLPGYRTAQLLLDFGRGAEQRQAALLRIRAQRALFQPFGSTAEDRYPYIFAFLQQALGADAPVRILSFGCSTGEEVTTLRRYFPNATIKGVDISPERIAVCRATVSATRTRFEVAETARGERDGAYDAVLAMAVFRHARLEDAELAAKSLLSFDNFEREVGELARAVRVGGYLVIRHANFRFMDTTVAAAFDVAMDAPCVAPLFDRDGARLPDVAYELAVFRKR